MNIKSNIKILLTLFRYKVSLAVTFTSITGYLIYSGRFDFNIIFSSLGVFLLASGASALNQYQERYFDAKMNRTKYRPLPSGNLSPASALLISIFTIIFGLYILYFFTGIVAASLGLFNIIWYNLLYTNLKKLTAFAVVPGSLTGAVPALIGWSAAGGNLFDPKILIIAAFLFIWQIPHFWLLLLKYGNEYEAAGYPSIHKSISNDGLRYMTFAWIIATTAISILFPVYGIINSRLLFIAIIVLNLFLVLSFIKFTFKNPENHVLKNAFISINAYMILVMLVVIIFHLVKI